MPIDRLARKSLEASMCDLFAECLDIETVSVTDDFFDVGGHSLLAAEVVARISIEFEVNLRLRDFFRNPTVAHVCELIAEQEGVVSGERS
ncbi:phosphopantetheine-binding protein [Micromonospora sp. NPDC048170]|uniref:phosphopantetheine-binding protein n=1 Tax=Micromonospora sp. NPDC048170 TaxID=3154819 RepID=UPI0034101DE4